MYIVATYTIVYYVRVRNTSHKIFFSLCCCVSALCKSSEPPLPDPIKLLRRIHGLEYSAKLLQEECGAMMERRKKAVRTATDQLTHLRELRHAEVSEEVVVVVSFSPLPFRFFRFYLSM